MGRGGRWRSAIVGLAGLGVACTPIGGGPTRIETMRVRWQRQPLVEALADPSLPPAWRPKIETVLAARQLADTLGLAVGEHFGALSRLAVDHPGYVLTAAPRAALIPYTWHVPALAPTPYRGFSDWVLADADAVLLEAQDYDTHVRIANRFRPFPHLPLPLIERHLRRDDLPLVRLVLADIQRETLALPGAGALTFTESLATFVAHRGAIALFAARAPESDTLRRAEVAWQAKRRYAAYLARLAREVQAAYRSAPDEDAALRAKARLLATARSDLAALSRHYEPMGIARLRAPHNNAALLNALARTSGLDVFEAVHERTRDLHRTLDLVMRVARARPDAPYDAIRDALLDGGPRPLILDFMPASPSPAEPPETPPSTAPADRAPPTADG
jgi:predicted aminopeptidase